MKTEKQDYESLTMEIVEVKMEKGYATSAPDLQAGGGW